MLASISVAAVREPEREQEQEARAEGVRPAAVLPFETGISCFPIALVRSSGARRE